MQVRIIPAKIFEHSDIEVGTIPESNDRVCGSGHKWYQLSVFHHKERKTKMNDIETKIVNHGRKEGDIQDADVQHQCIMHERKNDETTAKTTTRTIFRTIYFQFHTWPHLSSTLLLTIIGWVTLFILGALGWPIAPGDTPHRLNCEENYLEEPYCFCERLLPNSIIKQPSNTYSNLAYAIAALFCAWAADSKRFPQGDGWWDTTTHINLMTYNRYFTISFCLVATNISYSSGYLHASWTTWGDKVDSISIIVMFGWVFLTSTIKFWLMIVGWTPQRISLATKIHAILFAMAVVSLYGFYFGLGQNITIQRYLYMTAAALAVVFEVIRCFVDVYNNMKGQRQHRTNQAWWLGWMTVIIFAVGFTAQIVSKGGSNLCYPDSFFQGHALWHLLSGLALGFYFFFSIADTFTLKEEEEEKGDDPIFTRNDREDISRENIPIEGEV